MFEINIMDAVENLHMNGGVDEMSYSMNSSLQRKAISITRPIIQEALHDVLVSAATKDDNNNPIKTLSIADLGCSSGPNTLFLVSYVLDIVRTKCHQLGRGLPEFLVFLNDLPENDFNTIFRSLLPSFYINQQRESANGDDDDEGFGRPHCFVAGVPGSFHGRLFPSKSLHYVHSSFSVHWLSQIPGGIEANKGNIYISKSSPPAVALAYLKQFQSDFSMFLKARSEELVHGGIMVLTLLGRRGIASTEFRYVYDPLATALNDMVSEGMIEEEKLNSFNLPVYKPSPMELECAITNEGSFTINRLETFDMHWDSEYETSAASDVPDKLRRSSTNVANCIRAVHEPLLVGHFGDDNGILMDELFARYRLIVEDCMSRETTNHVILVVSLKRK